MLDSSIWRSYNQSDHKIATWFTQFRERERQDKNKKKIKEKQLVFSLSHIILITLWSNSDYRSLGLS